MVRDLLTTRQTCTRKVNLELLKLTKHHAFAPPPKPKTIFTKFYQISPKLHYMSSSLLSVESVPSAASGSASVALNARRFATPVSPSWPLRSRQLDPFCKEITILIQILRELSAISIMTVTFESSSIKVWQICRSPEQLFFGTTITTNSKSNQTDLSRFHSVFRGCALSTSICESSWVSVSTSSTVSAIGSGVFLRGPFDVFQSLRSHALCGKQIIACRMSLSMLLTIALKSVLHASL